MKLLIKSAQIIAAESSFHKQTADLLIVDGKLEKIASKITESADKVINIDGLHVSLGWFDSSVCIGEPGFEERETLANGLHTAALSGFSAIALNSDNYPAIDHHGAVDYLKHKSAVTPTSIYPIGTLTQKAEGKELAELYDMSLAGAVAFGDYKRTIENANLLKIAFQYAQGFDGLVLSFPNEELLTEHGLMNEGVVSTELGLKGIPSFVEALQISRDLTILEYTGGKLHIPTISTAESVRLIAEAKAKGLDVTCSVALHNLCFTEQNLRNFDSVYKVMPPLRTEADQQVLIAAVKEGTIDMVTSDHRPLNIELKCLELEHADFGSLGLESAFGALQNLFGLEKTIELLTNSYKRFGVDTPKLEEGSEANLSFFLPEVSYTLAEDDLQSLSKNSMYIGTELKGKALGIFAKNQLVLKDAE